MLIRLVFLMAVAALGCRSLHWLYLALPAAAALLIAQKEASVTSPGRIRHAPAALGWQPPTLPLAADRRNQYGPQSPLSSTSSRAALPRARP
jgi:hypothetical protein